MFITISFNSVRCLFLSSCLSLSFICFIHSVLSPLISHSFTQQCCDTNLIYLISCLSYNANECGLTNSGSPIIHPLTGRDAHRNRILPQTFVLITAERLKNCQIEFLTLQLHEPKSLRDYIEILHNYILCNYITCILHVSNGFNQPNVLTVLYTVCHHQYIN